MTKELRALQILAARLRAWTATIVRATQATSMVVTLDEGRTLLGVGVEWPAVGTHTAGEYHRTWTGEEVAADRRRGCDTARDVIAAVLEVRGVNSGAPTLRVLPAPGS